MAKTAVTDWSTTAGNNTDINSINIDEGMAPSNVNDAIRTIMSQIATFITGASFTGDISFTSTSAGATGPTITVFHNSASPAVNDVIASLVHRGRDSAGNLEIYYYEYTQIVDPTSTTEDASHVWQNDVAGVLTTQMSMTATGMQFPAIGATTPGTGAFTTLSATQLTGVTVNMTESVTTGGTSIDFTSIPSWARRIEIMFGGLSSNGTSDYIVQLGDSGGVETSGYVGNGTTFAGAVASTAYTTGFGVVRSPEAAANHYGIVTLLLENASTNNWVCASNMSNLGGATVTTYIASGAKATSATLDRVRITTAGGANTFDLNNGINVKYSS